LKTSGGSKLSIQAVNGCCYGRENNPDKLDDYRKLCGQSFWEFISGEPDLYLKIIEPLGHNARQKNDTFNEAYGKVLNRFTREFMEHFCGSDDSIDWEKLVKHNSSNDVRDKVRIPVPAAIEIKKRSDLL
jgi:hypothetical protein